MRSRANVRRLHLPVVLRAHRRFLFRLSLVGGSFVAALIGARVSGPSGPWLWNFDLPFFNHPIAVIFHDALSGGTLPLWNDDLGLGFPLSAEGQIGAFYPPNWLIFQLPPLIALDVARVVHLTLLGAGAGLLAMRLGGSRLGAFLAAVAIVLSGGVVSKLEWTNLIESFALVPWILLPLVRRPKPTRRGIAAAGILWGIQALTFHPNVLVLTGLAIASVLVAIRPRFDTLPRFLAIGVIAAGVGAVQLVPTLVLWTLSTRAQGLTEPDLFRLTAQPFDLLGTAFANIFVPAESPAMNLNRTWYPGGGWSQSEVAAYVGLPILALAAMALRLRRARPLVTGAAVMVLLPIIGGQRLGLWADIPIWNALHAPVKAYLFLDLFLVLLAAIGIGRIQRARGGWRTPAAVVAIAVVAYGALAAAVLLTPSHFRSLVERFWSWPPPDQSHIVLRNAEAALGRLWPVAFEVAIGLLTVVLIAVAARRARAVPILVMLAVAPLILLMPSFNQSLPASAFSFAETPLLRQLAALRPQRILALDPPQFWSGMPDQLAAAGLPDVDMFASLKLATQVELVTALRTADAAHSLARAVGIDTLVSVKGPCPGVAPVVTTDGATVCRIPGALSAPYWIPASHASAGPDAGRLIRFPTAKVQTTAVASSARPVTLIAESHGRGRYAIAAPADGWIWIDRAWYPTIRTLIDGQPVATYSAMGGTLVAVSAGMHTVTQDLVPWDVWVGAVLALITLAATLLCIAPRRAAARNPSRDASAGPGERQCADPALQDSAPAPGAGYRLDG